MGSREVADKFFIETKTAKWHWLIPFSASLILKAAESIAYLTSQLYNDLQPAVCLSREMELFKDRPSTCGCLISIRNKP